MGMYFYMHGWCSLLRLQLCIAGWTEVLLLFYYFWVDTISQEAIDTLKWLLLYAIMMFMRCLVVHFLPPLSWR